MKIHFLILILIIFSYLGHNTAFGHGVHSGVNGCPVGACGINDWHYLEFMKDVTFQFTLIIYGLILGSYHVTIHPVFRTKIRKNL